MFRREDLARDGNPDMLSGDRRSQDNNRTKPARGFPAPMATRRRRERSAPEAGGTAQKNLVGNLRYR